MDPSKPAQPSVCEPSEHVDHLRFHRAHAHMQPVFGNDAFARKADRDKASSEADARHREAIAMANQRRQRDAETHSKQLQQLLEVNTHLTEATKQMSERIEMLTSQLHAHLLSAGGRVAEHND
ncbi:hypothetical protein SHV74_10380 [Pseudomonas capeferrum]|uniref:hypothetical protein n=1 Tax=Pseudomonas TaxID=286 RepID=UPI0016488276|nr:hypothetical protein [Pseudomonas sp. SWRI77]MBC3482715.1 hypothetical protein [Pseudomonas sp. SWRI77]